MHVGPKDLHYQTALQWNVFNLGLQHSATAKDGICGNYSVFACSYVISFLAVDFNCSLPLGAVTACSGFVLCSAATATEALDMEGLGCLAFLCLVYLLCLSHVQNSLDKLLLQLQVFWSFSERTWIPHFLKNKWKPCGALSLFQCI